MCVHLNLCCLDYSVQQRLCRSANTNQSHIYARWAQDAFLKKKHSMQEQLHAHPRQMGRSPSRIPDIQTSGEQYGDLPFLPTQPVSDSNPTASISCPAFMSLGSCVGAVIYQGLAMEISGACYRSRPCSSSANSILPCSAQQPEHNHGELQIICP